MTKEINNTPKNSNKNKYIIVACACLIIVLILTLFGYNEFVAKQPMVESKDTVLTSEEVDNLVRNASNEITGDLSTYINNYFTENNITGQLSTDDINQIAEVISNGIIDNCSLSDEEITNLKHEILNQLLQNFPVSQDTNVSYLTEEVKHYVQETSVNNILNSIEIKNNTTIGQNNKESINELEEKFSSTKENIESVTENLQLRSNSLDEKINITQGTCDSLQERLTEITSKLENMDFSNQSDISKILQQVIQLQVDIQNTSDELNSLQQEKKQLSTDIADNKVAIENVNTNVIQANNNIAFNSSLINGLNDEKVSISDLSRYMLEMCYPVGSIYMSEKNISPAAFLGGSWEPITDTTLVGAGNSYEVGTTGGSSDVVLNAQNIPSLNITGATTSKDNISTTENGSYNGIIKSFGTYQGGTYRTSTDGEHTHSTPNGTVFMSAMGGNPVYEIVPDAVTGQSKWLWCGEGYSSFTQVSDSGSHNHTFSIPNQTITSQANLNIENHNHTINIPSLYVNATYINDSVSSVSVQNPYTAVYMWKRVS